MISTPVRLPSSYASEMRASGDSAWHDYVLIFVIAFAFLFLTTSRVLNLYDEGITLTAGLRVMDGQVPYRDFYFIYGPALPYIFGGLFRVFGPTVFVAFLFDLAIKALVPATFFAIARRYCSRAISILFTALLILWIFLLQLNLIAVTPVSLFSLWTLGFLLPVFSGALSARRFFVVGVFAAIAGLFRMDAGVGLLLITLCLLVLAAGLHLESWRTSGRLVLTCGLAALVGFLAIIGSALLAYRAVAPWHDLYFDLLDYPEHYYRVSRRLPLMHRSDLGRMGELTVLIPCVTVVLAVLAVARYWPRRRNPELPAQAYPVIGCLSSFALLAAAMYVKSLVRIDLWQNYLALVPTLLVLAVLLKRRSDLGPLLRGVLYVVTLFCIYSTVYFAMHTAHLERGTLIAVRPTNDGWCQLNSPATKHLCFLVDSDHIHTIEFLLSNTRPSDTLYVGLQNHERIFANDNVTYFAAGLLPATRWSHLDPHLQNTSEVQSEMIAEFDARKPPYIVLDSEYAGSREPNGSSVSSGVTLLDDYIRREYTPIRYFGELTIVKRK